jgi:xylan 1,4-beta-xylosidase
MIKKNLVYILVAMATIPIIVYLSSFVQKIISRASPTRANIIIYTDQIFGEINNSWATFSQGGEEPPPMLTTTIPLMKQLTPKFIRLDHIFDYYSIVENNDGQFSYNFSKLDNTVDDILSMGAIPFLCLSYMPSSLSTSGSVIDLPKSWNDWQSLVKATIEHYSGKDKKNLDGVYYEVWNEPELPQFGEWKLSGNKDYRLLYYHAIQGASKAINVNKFYIGGPGIGSYYKNWLNEFLSYVSQNKLRLDFFSWHRYHKNPNIYKNDALNIRSDLSSFSGYSKIPIILSEWGIESENKPINNSSLAAAYTVSAVSKFNDYINMAFSFEIKDGPPPNGGQWGLITHEKSNNPTSIKPRFNSFFSLNNLRGNKLQISGEGTYVSALASKLEDEISVVLSNFDMSGSNTENVPVTFSGLTPSSYQLSYIYALNKTMGKYDLVTTDGTLSKSFLMSPNSILVIKLQKTASLVPYILGRSEKPNDMAFVSNLNRSLIFRDPEFRLMQTETISFDIKRLWENNNSFIIFEAPYSTVSGVINRLRLTRQKTQDGDMLVFAIGKKDTDEIMTSVSIDSWQKNSWHNIALGWNPTGIFISKDGESIIKTDYNVEIRNGKILTFYPINAAFDNLKINIADQQTITRNFDQLEEFK